MLRFFAARRILAIAFVSIFFVVSFGLFQNFSEVGFQTYEYIVTDIGNLGGPLEQSVATAINNKGHIVGQSQTKNGEWHAFLWTPVSGMKDLGTLGGDASRAVYIDDAGDVYGESFNQKRELRRFKWSNGIMTDLGPARPGITFFNATLQAGAGPSQGGTSQEAVLIEGATEEPLGTLGGKYSLARGFSSNGIVVGEAENGRRILRPAIWTKSKKKYVARDLFESLNVIDLEGRANAVSANGQHVVGQATNTKGNFAFVWDENSGARDLNRLVRESDPEFPKRSWSLHRAAAVNDCGHIAGDGASSETGGGRAFLLSPVSSRCEK
ncbi:MAG TPA: hypothetical protein VFV50_17815 [Bdellovibrionales bacterium]|nr:hypothetical protein [Bdellovibrionales bacterium]